MVSNVFRVKGLNIHLGYDLYSDIAEKCTEEGLFSPHDEVCSEMTSDVFPSTYKRVKRKVYKAIRNHLERIAETNLDSFISFYYNHAYYDKCAEDNISAFLDGVASVYKHLCFKTYQKPDLRFPYGKKFDLCCKKRGKIYVEITIDTDDIACFWGSIDYFFIHFKSGFVISFNRGILSASNSIA